MKPYLLIWSLIFLFTFSALGQQADREVYPQQESIEHNDAVKSFSSDYISAFDGFSWLNQQLLSNSTGNTAFINVEGSENITILSQQGYGITGVTDIDGSGNLTNMQQTGYDLSSILSIKGDANQFDMTQEGHNLQNYFKVYGSGTNYKAHQTNAGMNFQQSGAGTIPLTIQQSGRTTPIIIRNY